MSLKLPWSNGVAHLPHPTGRYTVGCVDIFSRKEEGKLPLLYRLYYPTPENPDYTRWPSWLPHSKYAEGYVASTLISHPFVLPAMGRLLTWLCSDPKITANEASPPAHTKFPVVIFSHGLIGCRTTYSSLCTDISSQGYYVAALEHGDNSACVRMLLDSPDGEVEWMEREVLQPGAPETELRERQLVTRVREVSECLDSLHLINSGDTKGLFIKYSKSLEDHENKSNLAQFKEKIHIHDAIIAGHSMGGATAIRSLSLDPRFKGGVAFDSWMFPVRQDELNFEKSKILFVNFEKFQTEKNLATMSRYEADLNLGHISSNVLTLKNATHYACTDILLALQGTLLGGYLLGQEEKEFDSYQKVLTSSELFAGWLEYRLTAETNTFISACKKREEFLFAGVKYKE